MPNSKEILKQLLTVVKHYDEFVCDTNCKECLLYLRITCEYDICDFLGLINNTPKLREEANG